MPIYEYRCQSCEHKLDAIQKIADAPLTECPACGRPELRRLVSAPSFRLKGGGWYETDFKKENRRNLAQSDGAANNSGSGEGKSKDDAKSGADSAGKSAQGAGKDAGGGKDTAAKKDTSAKKSGGEAAA